ncbi:porin family protein [Aequorivita marina]|uniref:porin family protein n=1 Tax=Aequorivita marina TaxID=3073654 RepID=UPI0028746502|nr:porin family protein [Aequorivita sp. S2608]MDS1297538.1 porin family protein [Aequorivita sp. S2608]
MKKLLLFIAVATLTFTTSQSQEIRLGAKLGLNVASLGGDSYGVGSLGSRTSFHIGGLAEIPLSGNFALQPEILYSSEGSDWSLGTLGNADLKLDYIRVPVLAKYYIIEGLSAELGPSFGVLVSAKSDDEDIKEAFKSFDAAIAVGATYRLNMGVFFSLRYNKGLLDVNDDNESNFSNQSNVFQVSAGYSF